MRFSKYCQLLCCFLVLSCETTDLDTVAPPIMEEEPWRDAKLDFTAKGPDGTIYTPDEGPIEIEVGQSITYTSTSANVPKRVQWSLSGSGQLDVRLDMVTATYDTEGKYHSTLFNVELFDIDVDSRSKFLLEGGGNLALVRQPYVCVIDPFKCVLKAQESSDGRSVNHIFDDENFLIRADKFINKQLVEYSTFNYDDQNLLEQQQFFTELDVSLGFVYYERNSENHTYSERREDDQGTVLLERNFILDDKNEYPISAVYNEPDGLGGLITFDVAFAQDADNHNTISETFMQNNVEVGSTDYEFDNHPKTFTGLKIESAPLIFNTYNTTSIITKDVNGTILSQQSSTYQYNPDFCDQPISEDRTVNSIIIKFTNTF